MNKFFEYLENLSDTDANLAPIFGAILVFVIGVFFCLALLSGFRR